MSTRQTDDANKIYDADKIYDGVRQVLRSRLGIERDLEPRTDLLRDLKLDSIQQLTLIVELENHFRVCFAPGDAEGVSTIEAVVALIGARLQERGAGAAMLAS